MIEVFFSFDCTLCSLFITFVYIMCEHVLLNEHCMWKQPNYYHVMACWFSTNYRCTWATDLTLLAMLFRLFFAFVWKKDNKLLTIRTSSPNLSPHLLFSSDLENSNDFSQFKYQKDATYFTISEREIEDQWDGEKEHNKESVLKGMLNLAPHTQKTTTTATTHIYRVVCKHSPTHNYHAVLHVSFAYK